MASPPFSGQDYILPITPSNYVNDIEGNFSLTRTEILNLYAAIQSGTPDSSLFGAGILEVNGHFQLTRILNKLPQYISPAATDRVWSTNFFNLEDGNTLGYAGTNYTYHPTQALGWYIAYELLLGSTHFGDFTGTDEDIFTLYFDAGTRYRNPVTEDLPVFYQPVSYHLPRHRWAGKALTMKLKYRCNASQAAKLYGTWSGGANGWQKEDSGTQYLEDTGGAWRTIELGIQPDDDALYFEFGIDVQTTNAFTLDIEYFILTDNPNRYAGGEKSASMLAQQVCMGQRYYGQYSAVRTVGSFLVNPTVIVDTGAQIQDIMPFLHNQQMLAPGETTPIFAMKYFDDPDLWPLAETYSKEVLLWPTVISPVPGITALHDLWHRVNNTAAVSVRPRLHSVSDPGAYNPTLDEDMRQWYAAVGWEVYFYYVTDATDIRKLIPCCPSAGMAEAINNFPPLFT